MKAILSRRIKRYNAPRLQSSAAVPPDPDCQTEFRLEYKTFAFRTIHYYTCLQNYKITILYRFEFVEKMRLAYVCNRKP